jgi:polysaccharide export outer membrane protein
MQWAARKIEVVSRSKMIGLPRLQIETRVRTLMKHALGFAVFLLSATLSCAVAQDKPLAADVSPVIVAPAKHIKEVEDTYQVDLRFQNARYRLGVGDVISLTFPRAPEFNQITNILPDGFASLSEIGDIHVGGLTTQESAEAIQSAYSRILSDPIVTVQLKDFNKPFFLVTGHVNKPGKYELRGHTSAMEALAIAGGFRDGASQSRVLLFRRAGDDWYEVKRLNVKQLLQGKDLTEDAEVRPGDMLFVSQTFLSKVTRNIPFTAANEYSDSTGR